MGLETVHFQDQHLEEAAALAADRYRALQGQVPHLPDRYGQADVLLPMIRWIQEQEQGVVALHNDRIVGFLAGMVFDEFRGQRTVYSPEWANAASGDLAGGTARLYRQMYGTVSEQWVAAGCGVHLVSMLAHDRPGIEAWHWSGFGMMAVDGVRDLSSVATNKDWAEIRRVSDEDADQVFHLDMALHDYLASAPVFLYGDQREDLEGLKDWVCDSERATWLAYIEQEPVAYLTIGPANEDACTIIRDPGTASITGAFTRASDRGSGIGSALLDEALAWAREAGYIRCAVDFEPENVPGSRFWMGHFQPVCFSLRRYIDERLVPPPPVP